MIRPEEKLAARLIRKNGLKPPFDLLALVSLHADVEETAFPIAGDGISIGLGGSNAPIILINSEQVKTRKKFTLAHELGHVIIPWHTGTIFSDDSDELQGEFEYREMEAEANRFAAELLMPTEWVVDECRRSGNVELFFKKIINDSGVSRDAALIKIFNVIETPMLCIESNYYDGILKKFKPKNCLTPSFDFLKESINHDLINENIKLPFKYKKFYLAERIMHTWLFEQSEFSSTDEREWRYVLDDIIKDALSENPHKLMQSINATLASKYQRYKQKCDTQELCNNIYMGFTGVEKFEKIYAHPMFKSYIYKRVIELTEKDKAKNAN